MLFAAAPAFAGQVGGDSLIVSALSIDDGVPGDAILLSVGIVFKDKSAAVSTYSIAEPVFAVIESVESGVACSACSLSVGQSGQVITLYSVDTDGSGLHQFIKG